MLEEHLRLRADAYLTDANGETLLTAGSGRGVSLGGLTAGQRSALRELCSAERDISWLVAEATAADGWAGLANVHSLLEALRAGNWLRAAVRSAGRLLAVLVPTASPRTAARARQEPRPPGPGEGSDGTALVLSRFALLHRVGEELVLESPRARVMLQVSAPEVGALLGRLARPLPRSDAAEAGPWAAELLDVLAREGFAVPAHSSEDSDVSLLQWAPHELWFHVASSMPGRTADQQTGPVTGWGGTSWAEGLISAPAARVGGSGGSVPLPKPDLTSRAAEDAGFTRVLETRRSIREHNAESPLDSHQLGEFLYRTARVRGSRMAGTVEIVDRPYPSGGGLHELQLYVVAAAVAGVEPGMHRYDGWDHTLVRVAPLDADVRVIARHAAAAIRMNGLPQVVFLISARFDRTMWKYQSMAYALVLKNVGALMGAMYVVAAAMGLAPCAVGSGEAELFSRVTGLDPLAESVVGSFTLGSALPDAYTPRNQGV